MRFNFKPLISASILSALTFSCQAQAPHPVEQEFNDYWYAGKAELCHYDIKQLRYGEMRQGEAVLVFVTEDFNLEEHVKEEQGPSANSTKVLKLNAITRFITGIYDYSLMTSVFTPIEINEFSNSLKVTSSAQDWCGQTFTQLNALEDAYRVRAYSYFQAQGDRDLELTKTWLEDEIWNRIRINPQSLPLGNCTVIPSLEYFRMSHTTIDAYQAIATLTLEVTSDPDQEFFIYRLSYPLLMREFEVRFSGKFPYRVTAWETRNTDGELLSSGKLTHCIMEPYWKLNAKEHVNYRDSLNLDH